MINFSSTVFLEENKYIFENKNFEDFEDKKLRGKLKNKLRIVILGEELWIKKINYENKDLDRFIEDQINLINDPNGDLLYHNIKDKKKKEVYIYSIKGKKLVEKIIDKRDIEIIPIQFFITKELIKKEKHFSNHTVFIKVKNYHYLIKINDGKIISSDVIGKDTSENTITEIIENSNVKRLLIDKSISEDIILILKKLNIEYFYLKERLCEKLQKIY